jgi:hypothetical protein
MGNSAATGLEGYLVCAGVGLHIVTELPCLILIDLALILRKLPVGAVSYGITALLRIGYGTGHSVQAATVMI